MRWYKDINAILAQEPETWLAYLYGQQLDNIPHLVRIKPRYRGVILRLCSFVFFLFRSFTLRRSESLIEKADYVSFVGTVNQMSSLEETTNILKNNRKRVVEIAPRKLLSKPVRRVRYTRFELTASDIIKSLMLLFVKGPALYKELKKKHPACIDNYLHNFFSVYAYLVYFHGVLSKTTPEFVITANDHSPPNRSLLAIAHYMDIKTVYLQHASVSSLFPALRVNFAFLDGQRALDIYRECEMNQPATSRNVPSPQVLLTGQKKYLVRSKSSKPEIIGVALNPLDDVSLAIQFVKELAKMGRQLRVRWHPAQAEKHTQHSFKELEDIPQIQLSNPEIEPVFSFLEKIRWLVAGNSSIHLEAALAGVVPIYYEITPPDNPDYYKYVKHGIAKPARSPAHIVEMIESGCGNEPPSVDSLRYFSATYLTDWDGKEGELVAECLLAMCIGKSLPLALEAQSRKL